ncbi:MAG: hypothetical protein WA871_05495 [Candidatus Acidiferrales bacterium]
MAKCPHCMSKVPARLILSHSYGMECPHCHARIEVTDGGRYVAAIAGLAAATVVYRFARISTGLLGWALAIVYAIIAFGIVSPLILMLVAGLRAAPPEPEPIGHGSGAPAASHGSGHH